MSLFAVGDIHGHSNALDRLLAQLPLTEDDTLVFLGDYVDRGPDTHGVLERIMALKEQRGDRCVCLLGNHEEMLLDHWRATRGAWCEDQDLIALLQPVTTYTPGFWLRVGGEAAMQSYPNGLPEAHIRFLASLPLVYETDNYLFVHAGLRPRGETSRSEMLWGASGFWGDVDLLTGRLIKVQTSVRMFEKTVVVGHAAFEEPQVGPDFIGIDTGCGLGGSLTAVQLPEMRFYQERERVLF